MLDKKNYSWMLPCLVLSGLIIIWLIPRIQYHSQLTQELRAKKNTLHFWQTWDKRTTKTPPHLTLKNVQTLIKPESLGTIHYMQTEKIHGLNVQKDKSLIQTDFISLMKLLKHFPAPISRLMIQSKDQNLTVSFEFLSF